jgi:hypothetical protein
MACEKNDAFQSEADEHFSIIKTEIESMPNIPVNFYWELEKRGLLTVAPVTSCLTTEVTFDRPYIIANGVKFHAYYWTRTENKPDTTGRQVGLMKIAFNREP